jgi:2-amino-4-hydroxy-6-hydroxymethyldihydropteridine diphosphokinase
MTGPGNDAEGRLWYLGLGSNVGDRERKLREALARLDSTAGVAAVNTSSIYETVPWGDADQPPFLNMVALVRSSLPPQALLAEAKLAEAELGRRPTRKWGPREIDIDLLLCEGLEVDTPELKVPHPLMMERQFVLVPLAEIAPGLLMPDGRSAAEHVSGDGGVRLWSSGVRDEARPGAGLHRD